MLKLKFDKLLSIAFVMVTDQLTGPTASLNQLGIMNDHLCKIVTNHKTLTLE